MHQHLQRTKSGEGYLPNGDSAEGVFMESGSRNMMMYSGGAGSSRNHSNSYEYDPDDSKTPVERDEMEVERVLMSGPLSSSDSLLGGDSAKLQGVLGHNATPSNDSTAEGEGVGHVSMVVEDVEGER